MNKLSTQSIMNHLLVEVAYATPNHQYIIPVKVPADSSIEFAILASGICEKCPEIDLSKNKVGVFGCVLPLSHSLLDGDRVEIYRPLAMDPKKARLLRVQ